MLKEDLVLHSVMLRKLNDDYSVWPITCAVMGGPFKFQCLAGCTGPFIRVPEG